MSKLVITGGKKLKGEIAVSGSKNAVLPILAATVLCDGISIIDNCPRLKDVSTSVDILRQLGCKVSFESSSLVIDSSGINKDEIPESLANQMRSSIVFIGPMLSRFKKVTISYPGDCVIILAVI